jgi:hypothetical protein
MSRSVFSVIGLIIISATVGCGGGGGSVSQSTFSATGKLTVDDKPFGPATLTLSSTDKTAKEASITGNVKPDGAITFVTYGKEGVVVAGNYTVTMAGDIMTMKSVPATEPATIDIKSGDKNVDIKLKSIPGAAPVGGLAAPNLNQ